MEYPTGVLHKEIYYPAALNNYNKSSIGLCKQARETAIHVTNQFTYGQKEKEGRKEASISCLSLMGSNVMTGTDQAVKTQQQVFL